MVCPNCGRENGSKAKFCAGCGAVLENKSEKTVDAQRTSELPIINDSSERRNYNYNSNNKPQHEQYVKNEVHQGYNQQQYTNRNQSTEDLNSNYDQQYNNRRSGFNRQPVNTDLYSEYADPNLASMPYDDRAFNGYQQLADDPVEGSSNKPLVVILISTAVVVILILIFLVVFFFGDGLFGNDKSSSKTEDMTLPAPTTVTEKPIDSDNVITIPSITGFSYNDAISKLRQNNLQSSLTAEYSDIVPENCIIRQSPNSGTEAREGDVVSIVVSKGTYVAPNYDSYGMPSYARSDNSYIFSQSSTNYLTKSDISGLSPKVLELGRNEIYARHGRRFNSRELQNYFNSKSWYIGIIEPEYFSESDLNQCEQANVDFLQEAEDNLKKPSSSSSSSSSKSNSSTSSTSSKPSSSSSSKPNSSNNTSPDIYPRDHSEISKSYDPIFTEIYASSSLKASNGTSYVPKNVCYDDKNCWAEGASGVGIDEWLLFEAEKEQKVSGIKLVNGFAKSPELYNNYGKATQVRFEFSDGSSYTAALTARDDATNNNYKTYDYIDLPHTVSTTYIKIIIEDAVSGTQYSDTCITLVAPY